MTITDTDIHATLMIWVDFVLPVFLIVCILASGFTWRLFREKKPEGTITKQHRRDFYPLLYDKRE